MAKYVASSFLLKGTKVYSDKSNSRRACSRLGHGFYNRANTRFIAPLPRRVAKSRIPGHKKPFTQKSLSKKIDTTRDSRSRRQRCCGEIRHAIMRCSSEWRWKLFGGSSRATSAVIFLEGKQMRELVSVLACSFLWCRDQGSLHT